MLRADQQSNVRALTQEIKQFVTIRLPVAGAEHATGPTVSQGCAASARAPASTACVIDLGKSHVFLANAADRISNGPHIYCPDPRRPGRMGVAENCVWVTFNRDLYAKAAITVPEIVASANTATGNIHRHSDSKFKLFHRMLAPWLKKGFDRKAEIGSLATGPERLRRVLTFLWIELPRADNSFVTNLMIALAAKNPRTTIREIC